MAKFITLTRTVKGISETILVNLDNVLTFTTHNQKGKTIGTIVFNTPHGTGLYTIDFDEDINSVFQILPK